MPGRGRHGLGLGAAAGLLAVTLALTGCGPFTSSSATCKLTADPTPEGAAELVARARAFGNGHGYVVTVSDRPGAPNGLVTWPIGTRPAVRIQSRPAPPGRRVAFFYSVPGAYPSERVQADVAAFAAELSRDARVGLAPLATARVRSLRGPASACLRTSVRTMRD